MRFASAIDESDQTADSLARLVAAIRERLGGEPPDLLLLFVSPHHSHGLGRAIADLASANPGTALVGVGASGVIGEGHEAEGRRAIAAVGARLPGVRTTTFHIDAGALPDADADAAEWEAALGLEPGDQGCLIVLADPFSCDVTALLAGVDAHFPDITVVGGLASGAAQPGGNALLEGGRNHKVGAVGALLRGDLRVRTVVAQGCRPIGEPMLITSCDGQVVRELGGRPPVVVLRELYQSLGERDRELFRHSLFVGIEMADRVEYHQGDFLIRHITGMDAENGAIGVSAQVKRWQAVQFHLRDARTSRADLEAMLGDFAGDNPDFPVAGALMFSCMGRGLHLYQRPDHDTDLFREHVGSAPLAGMFGNGEIGPVAGRTYLHGYTSVFALFSPPAGEPDHAAQDQTPAQTTPEKG